MLAADADHPAAHHLLHAHRLAAEQPAPAEAATLHGRADQVAEADDAHQLALLQYRQGFQVVAGQHFPGLLKGGFGRGELHIARHHRSRGNTAKAALQGVLLGGEDDALQLVTGDIDELAQLFQGLVQVFTADADPLAGQRVMGVVQVFAWHRAFRVAHPRQTVVGDCHCHQDQRIEQHRLQQVIAHGGQPRVGQHRAHCHTATRRVQAAQQAHDQDRDAERRSSHPQLGAEAFAHGQPHCTRQGVAAQHRPRLGQGAGMHRKHQYRRSSQRAEQVQGDAGAIGQAGQPAREEQAKQRTDTGTQPFFWGDVERGRQQPLQTTFGTRGRHLGNRDL
ncbi:hypothetical protein D3C80_1150170 [compost metagenome]